MIVQLLSVLAAAAPPVEGVRPPIVEIDHPRYEDAAGRPLAWRDVRALARGSDALGQVRRRRVGRTVLRVMFAGATAAEAWGTARLAAGDSWVALPLAGQTVGTGLCAVLSWTNLPSAVVEDRTLILDGANGALGSGRGGAR